MEVPRLRYNAGVLETQVDAQMLQYQNHKLSQQLEVQRNEITVLEGRLKQLHSKQALFDENLSIVSRVWNQVRLLDFCAGFMLR